MGIKKKIRKTESRDPGKHPERTRLKRISRSGSSLKETTKPSVLRSKYMATGIEKKWQTRWEDDHLWHSNLNDTRRKFYFLTMLPYPSGDLHIGHWYAMVPSDVKARYFRMRGFNVFLPMGFDAFGLPAENAAIKHQTHPHTWTMSNIENMRRQLRSMGAMFDWAHEVITCDPRFYKWNQWFFIQMFKRGLAYKKMAPVDWCPNDQTVLAREQVWGEDRHCERCGTPVIKRDLEQWFLKITAYADELLDFSKLEWPERVKTLQTNWIGRSEGVQFSMKIADSDIAFSIFTTRPDTIFGTTFAVLAPEHPLVEKITTPEQKSTVEDYIVQSRRKGEIERLYTQKAHDGVFSGAYAINPLNGAHLPIYIADYVIMTYGTGAIMGVPAHDERDFAFAKRFGLPITVVVAPPSWDGQPFEHAYVESGLMFNSGEFNGINSEMAKQKITEALATLGIGSHTVTYRLRDWLISRQRYWGTPIPIVYCSEHGAQTVPENELPVVLPLEGVEFMPTGESPLTRHKEFLDASCPVCGKISRRETDTMDTFIDSSWYQYAYLDPYNTKQPINHELVENWLPVDQYTGGVEHATMHLLYTRFWTKVMRDIGLVSFDEPMIRLYNQGTILAPRQSQGEKLTKMSKSKGNVVSPDEMVGKFGADTVRIYLMFIGPWDQGGPWDGSGMGGIYRWMQRIWTLINDPIKRNGMEANERAQNELRQKLHQTIKKVTLAIESFRFNVMIAALMEFTNYLQKSKATPIANSMSWKEAIDTFLLLLAPSAPHFTEELWAQRRNPYSIHQQQWPQWDEKLVSGETFTLIVQVNGRVRDRIELPVKASEKEVREIALESENVKRHIAGKEIANVIYAPGRLVNIVVLG